MLIELHIQEKSIGSKLLYENLKIVVGDQEKVALIGRNGTGKTTLLNVIEGKDKDYSGNIIHQKDLAIIATSQEHHEVKSTALEYIIASLPHYTFHKEIVDTYPDKMQNDMHLIGKYSDSLSIFTEHNYYDIEERIIQTLEDFGITLEKAFMPLTNLSGGEKRFVELVKVMFANPDIALIDEPTNHMDFKGKEDFITWMKYVNHAILVVTHDRDVLACVDRIIEIKDKKAVTFTGNYDAYLKQNSLQNITDIKLYEENMKKLEKLQKQIHSPIAQSAQKSARIMRERMEKEYEKVKKDLDKPSFWIDEESINAMNSDVVEKYEKFKDRNITINTNQKDSLDRELLRITSLSLGYEQPLFADVAFIVTTGEKIFIKGRNGAGKTTLIKSILATSKDEKLEANLFAGSIVLNPKTIIGIYEQEIHPSFLDMTIEQYLQKIYDDLKLPLLRDNLYKTLASYMFDPYKDVNTKIAHLSGGQKARLQIIKMFASKPNLLILDEPTNHLDLPSIEEFEKTLGSFLGGIVYVSHDSSFIKKMQGKEIVIAKKEDMNK